MEFSLEFSFRSDLRSNAGFDLGYEIWRYDPVTAEYSLVYTQDPPEEGMEEASDLGMFYDTTVSPGQTYTYKVILMNRDGDYSNSTTLNPPITIPAASGGQVSVSNVKTVTPSPLPMPLKSNQVSKATPTPVATTPAPVKSKANQKTPTPTPVMAKTPTTQPAQIKTQKPSVFRRVFNFF